MVSRTRETVVVLRQTSKEFSVTASGRMLCPERRGILNVSERFLGFKAV